MENKFKIGLIVNPIAGMGGKVGLKGTDGKDILKLAIEKGAEHSSHLKAERTLSMLQKADKDFIIYTSAGNMGEALCKKCSLPHHTVYFPKDETDSQDTENAAKIMLDKQCDVIVFAGGDGTARSICSAVGKEIPVLGIPAGVKIQSSVFSLNPEMAGKILEWILSNKDFPIIVREVVDLDEDAYRSGTVSAKLYGEMAVPNLPLYLQNMKQGGYKKETASLNSIASYVVKKMEPNTYYIIGSGSTAKCVNNYLNLKYDLLGIDVIYNKELVATNLSENQLWDIVNSSKARLIVSPIGGQGFLFGRGNHQLSSRVLEKIGKDNIQVIAPTYKILSISDGKLHLDCEDKTVEQQLRGYYKVLCGHGTYIPLNCI